MTQTTKPYICQFCNHGYSRESTLQTHVCEPKRRAMAQKEKHVIIAFDAFNRYFKANRMPGKTYEEFCKSNYYNGFIKFGSYVNNVNPLYPNKYIDFVISSGVKLDKWTSPSLYDKYVVDLIRTENVETALTRSVNHMVSWAENNNTEWNNYFDNVSLGRATYDIQDGKISPWLLLNSTKGKALLQRLDDNQLSIINAVINPIFWMRKFKKTPHDVALVKKIVQEGNL